MVLRGCTIIGEHVCVIFVAQWITMAAVWPAEGTLDCSFGGL